MDSGQRTPDTGQRTTDAGRQYRLRVAELGVRFLYLPASDLEAMRHFYSELLGLDEIWFTADQGVAYDCDGLQFTILQEPEAEPVQPAWATQPGWLGDTVGAISWSVVLSESGYRSAVDRLVTSPDITRLHGAPQWVGYWSFPVRDPMGNTVELSWPEITPSSTTWTEQ